MLQVDRERAPVGRAHYTIEGVPLVGERRTAPLYRFFSVRDEFPALYPAAEGGQPILGELYDVPMGPLNALLATEPAELELSIIELEDGELSFAMLLREAEHAGGIHKDITSHGGWRAYRASLISRGQPGPVSYTHLTLPTKRIV